MASELSKTYTFIYKTTNRLNNKIYIGYHTTDTLEDGYIGCGVDSQAQAEASKRYGLKSALIDAVCKYGYPSFTREILEFFPTVEEAKQREAEIVDVEFVKRKDTYNLRTGGSGGGTINPLFEKYDEIVGKFANGRTLKEIAKEYGVGLTLIRKIIRSKGEQIERKIITPADKKYAHCKDEMIALYKDGTSFSELARRFKCDWKTVKKFTNGVTQNPEGFIGISPEKEVIRFTSFKKMTDKYGLFYAGIKQCLNGEIRHYKDWLFFKEAEWDGRIDVLPKNIVDSKHKGLKVINPLGEILEVHSNLSMFVREHNLCYERFHLLVQGKIQHCKGWTLYEKSLTNEENSKVL